MDERNILDVLSFAGHVTMCELHNDISGVMGPRPARDSDGKIVEIRLKSGYGLMITGWPLGDMTLAVIKGAPRTDRHSPDALWTADHDLTGRFVGDPYGPRDVAQVQNILRELNKQFPRPVIQGESR